jgi:hypothetical protein
VVIAQRIAIGIVAEPPGTGLYHRMRLIPIRCRTEGRSGLVGIRHAGLAGQVADRIVGIQMVVGRRCGWCGGRRQRRRGRIGWRGGRPDWRIGRGGSWVARCCVGRRGDQTIAILSEPRTVRRRRPGVFTNELGSR